MGRWVSGQALGAVQSVQKVRKPKSNEPFEPIEPYRAPEEIDARVRTAPARPVGILSTFEAEPASALSMPVLAWRAGGALFRPAPAMGNLGAEGWARFVNDCRLFVNAEWAITAATLGWDARQLFGCHRNRHWISSWWGALWFIGGGQILATTNTTISLKTIRGARRSVRKPAITGYDFIVPVWDVHE
jgi:hypothetical protein